MKRPLGLALAILERGTLAKATMNAGGERVVLRIRQSQGWLYVSAAKGVGWPARIWDNGATMAIGSVEAHGPDAPEIIVDEAAGRAILRVGTAEVGYDARTDQFYDPRRDP